jgi:N-acetylmuramoyl-L-alanine amidase
MTALEQLKERIPQQALMLGGATVALLAAAAAFATFRPQAAAAPFAELGQGREGSVTVALAPRIQDTIYGAPNSAGRPIVVLDPGHGGHDPGATGISGEAKEAALTLALANELRDALVKRGRVRVTMTRSTDTYLGLEERAAVARRTGAALFLSIHMDSALNPLARGATVYSLSDVASDAEAERFARKENASGSAANSGEDPIQAMLSELSARAQMAASADLAARMVRKAAGRVELRPEPHRFAAFHVLRSSGTAAVLFEAGYLSNVEDEALLQSPGHRARIVTALAQAIETDVAARSRR